MLHRLAARASMLVLAFAAVASAQVPTPADLSVADRAFAEAAVSFGIEQVSLGELAAVKSAAPDVQQLGRALARDHARSNDELEALLERMQIEHSPTMSATSQARVALLGALAGGEFDRAFRTELADRLQSALSLYRTQSVSGDAPGLKGFAARSLPMLETHLTLLQAIEGRRISSAAP